MGAENRQAKTRLGSWSLTDLYDELGRYEEQLLEQGISQGEICDRVDRAAAFLRCLDVGAWSDVVAS